MKYYILTYIAERDIMTLQNDILQYKQGGDILTYIQYYRELRGITQVVLAKKLGVSQGAVSNWENGDRKPDVFMMKQIAEILDCTVDELLTEPKKEENV